MINRFEHRISNVEKILQNKFDDESPCYGLSFPSSATDEEIIKALKISPKEFTKWKKSRDNFGGRLIFSPNWSIEKYFLSQIKKKSEIMNEPI